MTWGPTVWGAPDDSPFAERLTRLLSSDQRSDEVSLQNFRVRLDELPPLSSGHRGENAGFHSRFQSQSAEPMDIVIDLGRSYPIDQVVVFPARGMFRGARVGGYGFPEHFVVELSRDTEFAEVIRCYDSRDERPSAQADYPTQIVLQETLEARFLRLRVLEHWTRDDGRILSAFGEIMVLAEGRNVALRAKVEADAFIALPDWDRDHLVDGQTDLGLPIEPQPSPTNGFLSQGHKQPLTKKWVQLKLAAPARIDEVVLIPAQPMDAPDQFGHGFPRRFRLLVSTGSEFGSPHVLSDHLEKAFPNPGDNPVVFSAGRAEARFVRLEVEEMWHISNGFFNLALAEVQVFADGKNVALGAEVTASDVFSRPAFDDVWKPEYLVDGFSSQNRLIGFESWLAGLAERQASERQINDLERRIGDRVDRTFGIVLGFAAMIVVGSLGLVGFLVIRRKRAMRQQQETIRARIARDLHDDIGSRLGGIRLLSENLLEAEELPEDLKADLDLLHRSSGEATDAMRDIVWLLDTRERSLGRLRQQMRRLIPSILVSIPYEFEAVAEPEAEVGFEFRRQVLLAFRETLNNAGRHSHSDRIGIRIGGNAAQFWFEVRDWGRGFTAAADSSGHGVANLRKRAESLGGEVEIDSVPGAGTTVLFSAPYELSKRSRSR